ncbi:low molecular weight phosphotyrosine protein phosphatase [Luteolibacter flavescens]|uniref:Low molecular weight phosphotyrosine protein phosphatase n=1 Tax=Luteolibacter flavescens TaxID=1859460 RepID=A0ABT3FVQ7_9BACT|nr:low molecular weight protein-tyrosine-phosphatase [Luteolibacter flavescens]MCW1887664.1 low molecular weight phosphotyrosine protein phosphatase [Luteolibacter flavescens]
MPADRKPFRVLFVCMGNICRSPAAEIVFRKQVDEEGLTDAIHIDSAGTIGYHAGKGPDPRMADTLRRRGYEITGRSRQVTSEDLRDFDLVLAADEDNLKDLRRLDRAGTYRGKIRLLVEYCVEKEASHVPDPYYGGQRGFEEVADLVEDACQGLLDSIKRQIG